MLLTLVNYIHFDRSLQVVKCIQESCKRASKDMAREHQIYFFSDLKKKISQDFALFQLRMSLEENQKLKWDMKEFFILSLSKHI